MNRTEQSPRQARVSKKASSNKDSGIDRVDVDLAERATPKEEAMNRLLDKAAKGRSGTIVSAGGIVVIETIPGKGHTRFLNKDEQAARIGDKNNSSANTPDKIIESRVAKILDELHLPFDYQSSLHRKIVDLVQSSVSEALERQTAPDALSPSGDVASLPVQAPEIYGGMRGPETPPEFVKRVYAPWLGHGLDRAHIKHLDPTLYQAINNWSRKNEWPADVDLPTRSEQTQRTIEQLKQQAPEGRIGKVLGNFTAREAQRIRSALHRDRQKQ